MKNEIPIGWHKLNRSEKILKGDKFWCANNGWMETGNYSYVGGQLYLAGGSDLTYIRKDVTPITTESVDKNRSYTVQCHTVEEKLSLFVYFISIGWQLPFWAHEKPNYSMAKESFKRFPWIILYPHGKTIGGHYIYNNSHVEISYHDAINILGKISPFPIEVELNDTHKAIVDVNGDVQIGGQLFSSEKILHLSEIIKSIKANK